MIRRLRELQRQTTRAPTYRSKLVPRQEGGGEGLHAAGHPHADEDLAGHIRNIPLALDRKKLRQARRREGSYLLRSNLKSVIIEPSVAVYCTGRGRASVQGVEERSVGPSDLSANRIEAHISLRLAYCLLVTLETAAEDAAPGIDGEGRARKTHPRRRSMLNCPRQTIGSSSCPVIRSQRRIN